MEEFQSQRREVEKQYFERRRLQLEAEAKTNNEQEVEYVSQNFIEPQYLATKYDQNLFENKYHQFERDESFVSGYEYVNSRRFSILGSLVNQQDPAKNDTVESAQALDGPSLLYMLKSSTEQSHSSEADSTRDHRGFTEDEILDIITKDGGADAKTDKKTAVELPSKSVSKLFYIESKAVC
jgi:hypothetical protein